MAKVTAVLDAHVHIHDCYNVDDFFDHACRNLNRAPSAASQGPTAFYLLFSECAGDNYFGRLRDDQIHLKRWSVSRTQEAESLVVSHGATRLNLVAGRQVACKEGLEVLLLGTTGEFKDRRPIREVLAEGEALGVPRVIPWGAGKWFFKRARLLSQLVQEKRGPLFFLGDEGGRPAFWPYPRHFREAAAIGVRDLPGTDPLPFPHDIQKVGRVGFSIPLEFDAERPAASLWSALRAEGPLNRFAKLEPPVRFVWNQFAMQLRKRHAT